MNESATVVTDELTRNFGETIALDSLTLNVAAGEVFGILGHNGAGKTTTVRLLNGLLQPTGGSAKVFGLSPTKHGPQIRARTGVLTETPALDDRLTGRENLRFYARVFGLTGERPVQRSDELLEMFGLADRGDERVGTYSRGMRQRIALARTMLHHPSILFLDEPTSGLDPVAARQVQDMVLSLREAGTTVIMCTHNLEEAERVCDRVAVLEYGRVIALGSPGELATGVAQSTVEVDLDASQQERAITIVMETAPQLSVTPDSEGTLHLEGLSRAGIPAVLAALVRADIAVFRVAPQKVSLEDVYFALHKRDPEL